MRESKSLDDTLLAELDDALYRRRLVREKKEKKEKEKKCMKKKCKKKVDELDDALYRRRLVRTCTFFLFLFPWQSATPQYGHVRRLTNTNIKDTYKDTYKGTCKDTYVDTCKDTCKDTYKRISGRRRRHAGGNMDM